MRRPIYTPASKIKTGYTTGKEYVTSNDRLEYKGPFHVYPNGTVYTGSAPNKAMKQLLIYTSVYNDPNTSTYAKITGRQYNNHVAPTYYYPRPTPSDYRAGFIDRFFVQKINEPDFIREVSQNTYKQINSSNRRGINLDLYRRMQLKWLIVGDTDVIESTNKRIVQLMNPAMPGIIEYLSNLTEFAKT